MDFTKFVALLEAESLYFSRTDLLGDPFEGSFPKANVAARQAGYAAPGTKENIPDQRADGQKFLRTWTFVNCWHMNRHESAGMWRLYAQTSEAIAIRTSVGKLDQQLDDQTFLGKVTYIDFDQDQLDEENFFYSVLHKRLSFAHENELRAIKWSPPMTPGGQLNYAVPLIHGKQHKVQLEALFDAIYVAPTCASWFKETVVQVVKRYGLTTPVCQSALDSEPLF
jgi:hypothetical protein